MSDLYDTDFLRWTEQQAALLRRRAAGERDNAEPDWEHLAEEIEAVGRSERRELRQRLAVLLQHLLKWQCQPLFRGSSWRETIWTQRDAIAALLEDNPSLRPTVAETIVRAWPAARRAAAQETGLADLPQDSPFGPEQVLDHDFWPEA